MEKNFADPIAPKKAEKKANPFWSFECPPYDERSSCFVNAGSYYGIGHKQPVGHSDDPKQIVGVLPQKIKAKAESYIVKTHDQYDMRPKQIKDK